MRSSLSSLEIVIDCGFPILKIMCMHSKCLFAHCVAQFGEPCVGVGYPSRGCLILNILMWRHYAVPMC